MPFDAKITHNVYFCDNKLSKLRWHTTPIARPTTLNEHVQRTFENQLHIVPLSTQRTNIDLELTYYELQM